MSLEETSNRLLEEKERLNRRLLSFTRDFGNDCFIMTENEIRSYKIKIRYLENKILDTCKKINVLEEGKRICKEMDKNNCVPSSQETRKSDINKRTVSSKKGPKPYLTFEINGKNFRTKHKIEILREFISSIGKDRFLEIISNPTFKFKKSFTNRDYQGKNTSRLHDLNMNVSFSSDYIFQCIQEILPHTNIHTMKVSMENKNLIHYSRS